MRRRAFKSHPGHQNIFYEMTRQYKIPIHTGIFLYVLLILYPHMVYMYVPVAYIFAKVKYLYILYIIQK
jgi:hypothetical protein